MSSDQALSTSMLSGAVFDDEVRRLRPALASYARRLTGFDTAAGEDLVQEALTRAWAARRQFQMGSNLKAWLFRIVRNCFLSSMRRQRRSVEWVEERDATRLVAVAEQEDGLFMRDLDRAMMCLPAEQRQALAMIGQGLGYDAAATRLNVPLGTLKSRVARARATLIAHFDQPALPGAVSGDALPTCTPSPEPMPARAPAPSTYALWKASGARMIG